MPLKLTVSKKDQIVMSNGVMINVKKHNDDLVVLEFDAPPEIKIHAIFNDPSQQFKNLRSKEAGEAQKRPTRAVKPKKVAVDGQLLSPSEQRAMALRNLNKRNGK